MQFIKENKTLVIAIAAVVLGLGGLGYMLFAPKTQAPQPVVEAPEIIPTIKPEEIGLDLVFSSDKKKVKVIIENTADIKSLEFDVIWDAVSTEDASVKVERGSHVEATIKSGQTKYESDFIDLGSCSSGRCKYDQGVTFVKVLLKITKKDGKVFSAEKKVDM